MTRDAAPRLGGLGDALHEVVDLARGGLHHDFGVDEAGGPDDLVHHLGGDVELVGAGSGRQEDDLAHLVGELVEGERSVVERRGETEPVLHEGLLARTVTFVLPVDLRDRHVALVDHGQEVGREEVEKGVGGLPGAAAVEMPAVILDAVAHPDLGEHLEVVLGPQPEPLGLEQLAGGLQLGQALTELGLDRLDGAPHGLVAGAVVGGGEHHELLDVLARVAGQGVEAPDALHLVAEELDAHRLLFVHRMELHGVAADTEAARA